MKVHISPAPPGDIAGLSPLKAIHVLDLTAHPAHRSLWRSARAGASDLAGIAGLPGLGYRSPMGYWLSSPVDSTPISAGSLSITFAAPGEESSAAPESLAQAPNGTRSRPLQTVRVKSPNSGDGDIHLTIGAGGARIVTSEAAWKTLAEPILLAACQYWRFTAIDAELARLTELAHGDLGHATMPDPSSLKSSRRLTMNALAVRALLLDLPHFEGPLTDPAPYCSTERAGQAFSALAEKLHLEEWCELIDERAEAVEDTYEAVTEKLFEYKNFAWEAFLEVVIVVILVAELAVMAWDAFGQ